MNTPPTTRLSAVVFDMDGLMFNTEDLYDQAGDTLLARRGQRFTHELKLAMMGLPGADAFAVMIERCGLSERGDTIEQLKIETDEIFRGLIPDQIERMPGLVRLLEEIDARGIPRAVATSSHRQFADRALGHFLMQPGFQFVLTAEDVTRGKPNPEVYLLAASKLGVNPASILVLEDSVTGSTAAAAAGAYVVAVPTKHSQGLDYSHVRHVADRLDDPFVMQIIQTEQLDWRSAG